MSGEKVIDGGASGANERSHPDVLARLGDRAHSNGKGTYILNLVEKFRTSNILRLPVV